MNLMFNDMKFAVSEIDINDDALEIFLRAPREKKEGMDIKHIRMLIKSRHTIPAGAEYIEYEFIDTDTNELLYLTVRERWMPAAKRIMRTRKQLLNS